MSSNEGQMGAKHVVESLLENKYIDLILFCAIALGFLTMLILSATSA